MTLTEKSPTSWRNWQPEAKLKLRDAIKRKLIEQKVAKEIAPLSFREFVNIVKPKFQWHKHNVIVGNVLQRVADGELKRVMIFEPPRHGKSEQVSRLFSAYCLYRFPDQFVGINSYSQELANTLSRAARENYKTNGGRTKTDADSIKHWETYQNGGLWAAGVGGPIMGKGFHFGIIDDPLKNAEEANSEVVREGQKEWYRSTFYTRAEPDAAIVLIGTRWQEDDLFGWLLSEEGIAEESECWHIVSLEAIKESESPHFPPNCTVEPDFREPGEALCPERYPLERLLKICVRIGEYFWSALYQQTPHPKGGLFFDKTWFHLLPAKPLDLTRIVRYWDLAGAAPGKGDWTVGVLMGRRTSGRFVLLDVARFQKPSNERNKIIKDTATQDRIEFQGRVKTYIEQAPGLAKESTDNLVLEMAGFNVEADPAHKDKVTRAEPFQSQARAGNCEYVYGDWNVPYFKVAEAFPFGKNDDDIDASSGAFKKLTEATGDTGYNPMDMIATGRYDNP